MRRTRLLSRRRKLESIEDVESGSDRQRQRLSRTYLLSEMRRRIILFGPKLRQTRIRMFVLGMTILLFLLWLQVNFDPLRVTRWVDHHLTYRIMRAHFAELDADLRRLGVHLPPIRIAKANEIRTNAAIRNTVLNRARRRQLLHRLDTGSTNCHDRKCIVPSVVFSPATGGPPLIRPSILSQFNISSVAFDESEMRTLVARVGNQTNQDLILLYDNLTDRDERTILWAVCTVYIYGGIGLVESFDSFRSTGVIRGGLSAFVMASSAKVGLLAAPPRHPFFLCVLRQSQLSQSVSQSILDLLPLEETAPKDQWALFAAQSGPCRLKAVAYSRSLSDNMDPASLFLHIAAEGDNRSYIPDEKSTRTTVAIRFSERHTHLLGSTKKPKHALQSQLRLHSSEPGWLCNRCLNYAGMGSYELCRTVCPDGYEQLLCQSAIDLQKNAFELSLSVRRPAVYAQRIPRIIHQTFWDEVSFDHFPQLARLQTSWKNSGWEYRFYTDTTAREYIAQHFPPPFVAAFDAIIHGAYKADLFRYLVLLIDGGIYADIDVLLETSLDSFITPDLSFFGPRDIPCEYAGEAFCIWNGLIGAEPGHPVLVRAVERIVNLIQHRADMYDMEQEICQRNGPSASIWKLRAQPLLFLTGPCGLGVALNEAMGKPSLATVPTGWIVTMIEEAVDQGDVLILVGDKHDLGAFRFSDPERNFIVASTDLLDLDRSRYHWTGEQTKAPAKRLHYSNSRKYMAIWGSSGVYADDQVTDEYIQFNASYSQV